MKRLIPFVFCVVALFKLDAQSSPAELNGKWLGTLNAGIQLRLVFNISVQGDSLISTLDSPDQDAYGIPTSSTTFRNDSLHIEIPLIKATYDGVYDQHSHSIDGLFFQGASFPVKLIKTDFVEPIKRPQTPKEPFPYKEEFITFQNEKATGTVLSGTLTIPAGEGPFRAVVLVSGSGPQDRNETLLGHSPFWVLADYLTRHNIIVLRYDDRGIGESTGDFEKATSLDFASDAGAAADYLYAHKEQLHISEIGIAGHSEGGLIAPITANSNPHVGFIILLAGPGIPGDSILDLQSKLIMKADGMSDTLIAIASAYQNKMIETVEGELDFDIMKSKLIAVNKEFLASTPDSVLQQLAIAKDDTLSGVSFYINPWMKFFLSYDPQIVLSKTTIPVLAINGSKDIQVPPKENLSAIEKALQQAGNKRYKVVQLDGVNHLFQRCSSCTVGEYGQIEETMNEDVMKLIAEWILGL